ncbi:MAG: hypothetical protein MI810_14620 [Flavobacteriales bacterium]|nr:hypothetical protein [Flavobacteriales bacterium]
MIRFLFIAFSLFSVCFAQGEVFSVYFETNKAEGLTALKNVDKKYFNKYQLVEDEFNSLRVAAGDQLGIDETGIYIEKNRILNISREEVRENSKYIVKNGYLHGVLEDDSVQVALDGEMYYFLLPVKSYLFEVGNSEHKIYSTGKMGQFLVLSPDENHYSALLFQLNPGEVLVQDLDLWCDGFQPNSIRGTKTEKDEIPTFILNPTKDQWNSILGCFSTYDRYSA